MKKSVIIIIIISVIVSAIFVFLANVFLISTLKIGISQKNAPETYLTASQSPNGKYRLEAYRTEPGATVDFWLYVNSWGRDKTQIIGLCRRETLRHDFYV